MRYLRKFNEARTGYDFCEDFKSFSEPYLAFILDEGGSLKCGEVSNWRTDRRITNLSFTINFGKNLCWDDVKDTIVSYLELVESKYEFLKIDHNEFGSYKDDVGIFYYLSDAEIEKSRRLWAYPPETALEYYPLEKIYSDELGKLNNKGIKLENLTFNIEIPDDLVIR